MIDVLRHPGFRRLFLAQVVALVGTGLATVALALLAYDLAGERAGAVLGTALAIKMAVYVLLAPLAASFVPLAHRKAVLITLDIVRACIVLALPFVTDIWQVYLLVALLQSASACFTPLFQSLIPEILVEERDYTRALSLTRLAYDLENLLSPAIAAGLLTLVSFHVLFGGTSAGFAVSALLVFTTVFPQAAAPVSQQRPYARAFRGMRIYLHTPRLRGLLALHLCAAAGGAMVLVNTVVIVRGTLDGGDPQVAWALGAFGGGSMLVALLLPKLLDHVPDRGVMLTAALTMTLGLFATTLLWMMAPNWLGWWTLLPAWTVLGMAYSGLQTPGGRLLRRSARTTDLPSVFAAQFSLSHACWLVAYPLAGWLGAALGLGAALAALSIVALAGLLVAWRVWPKHDPSVVSHHHPELPLDHPHWSDQAGGTDAGHAHVYRIDELHSRWP
ncbi:MFS transporter [Luteimonas soli]|uniref:MFS transporter n=1 Tax=Luteimonas soli TaxID=1648966 RepID=A0ABV7XHC2_9GAMM